VQDVSRLVVEMEERERQNISKVLLEERRWYSGFVAGFSKSLVRREGGEVGRRGGREGTVASCNSLKEKERGGEVKKEGGRRREGRKKGGGKRGRKEGRKEGEGGMRGRREGGRGAVAGKVKVSSHVSACSLCAFPPSRHQDVEVSMFENVEKLKTILSELGDTVSQPNTLPITTQEFVEVRGVQL
jgi:hypothetical protein